MNLVMRLREGTFGTDEAKTDPVLSSYMAQAADEIDRLRAELESWTEAFGLLSTLHGTMAITVNDPMGMAQQIEAHVIATISRLRAELAALVNLRAEADSAWDSATYNAERARKAEAELAACRALLMNIGQAAHGADENGDPVATLATPSEESKCKKY